LFYIITDPRPIKQKSQNYIIDTIQEKIKNGTYEIDIAPSDLVDFGGQNKTSPSEPEYKEKFIIFPGIKSLHSSS
jgi:hypothetical protein